MAGHADIRFIKSMVFKKWKKMEFFCKIFSLTLSNIYLDDVLCDTHRPKCPLVDYIGFKSFKRIRQERQGEKQKGFQKIKTLAIQHLQINNKILFKPRRVVEQTILYKIRRSRDFCDVFWPNCISFTESPRGFFQFDPPTPPQENQKIKSVRLIDLSILLAY